MTEQKFYASHMAGTRGLTEKQQDTQSLPQRCLSSRWRRNDLSVQTEPEQASYWSSDSPQHPSSQNWFAVEPHILPFPLFRHFNSPPQPYPPRKKRGKIIYFGGWVPRLYSTCSHFPGLTLTLGSNFYSHPYFPVDEMEAQKG